MTQLPTVTIPENWLYFPNWLPDEICEFLASGKGDYWLVGRERCDTCHGAGTQLDCIDDHACPAGCLNGWTPTNGHVIPARRPGGPDKEIVSVTVGPVPVLVVPAEKEG